MSVYLIIFGAAVRPDGRPTGGLMRRIQGALAAAEELTTVRFVATGGLGRAGFVEAEVMARELRAAGVPDAAIIVEPMAVDTLESVRNCHAILQGRDDVDAVLVCTSPFHQPRCAMLFGILGYRALRPRMPRDLPVIGWAKWLPYVAKEFVSTPYDCLLLALGLPDLRRRR